MFRIPRAVTKSTPFRLYIAFLKRIYFTKKRINLYVFLVILQKETLRDNLIERSRAMSFSFMLSMFPAIIFVFTLIPYFPIPDLKDQVMVAISEVFPQSMYASISDTIYEILNKSNGSLMSFGFVLAMYSATNGIMAMIEAFNQCYSSADRRPFFKRLWISVQIITLLTLIVVIAIGLAIILQFYISDFPGAAIGLSLLKYVVVFLIFYFGISLIYYLAPVVHTRWNFFSHGSFIATVLIMILSYLFSFYVNNFNSYNKVYGSIGALIGIMLWFNIVSFFLLIGFEINACIERSELDYYKKKLLKE